MHIEKKYLLYGLLFFALGYTRLYFFMHRYHQTVNQLTHRTDQTIIATVQTIEQAQHPQYRYAMSVSAHTYLEQEIKKEYKFTWQLQCYSIQKPLCDIGDTIELNNIKIKTATSNSFGDFLLKEGIHATAFLGRNACKVIDHPQYSLTRIIHNVKYRLLTGIRKKCSYITTTLVSSIFLGNRLYVKEEYKKIKGFFCNWGIMAFSCTLRNTHGYLYTISTVCTTVASYCAHVQTDITIVIKPYIHSI